MNKLHYYLIFLLLCVILGACSHEDISNLYNPVRSDNSLNIIGHVNAGQTVNLYVESNNGYIDWGDGNFEQIANIASGADSKWTPLTHTYKNDSTYGILVLGAGLKKISFNASSIDLKQLIMNSCEELYNIELPNLSSSVSLNLKGCTSLVYLNLSGGNQPIQQIIEQAPRLAILNCSKMSLGSLDVSKLPDIRELQCSYNSMDVSQLTSLYNSLPDRTSSSTKGKIFVNGNPGDHDDTAEAIARNKNWDFWEE